MKIDPALKQVLGGRVIAMDTFRMNDHLSLNVSGIGFDGHVANLFGEGKKRGFWGYTKLAVQEYLSYNEFESILSIDGQSPNHFKSFIIAIANSSQYGNNARVAPLASVMDQSLQLAIVKKVPTQRGFPFAFQMFTGKLETGKDYECLAFKNGIIEVSTPAAYHIDGEPCGYANEFKIEILPRSLQMIAPAASLGKI
jgi:diacylglycerol kinase family enzyme